MSNCNHEHEHIINEVNNYLPTEENLVNVSNLFKIFGDFTITKILASLFNHELCVLCICETVGMNKSAVSHQLRVLNDAKLVKCRKVGKEVLYSLNDEHVVLMYKMALEHVMEE